MLTNLETMNMRKNLAMNSTRNIEMNSLRNNEMNSRPMKAQAEIIEYVFLTIFIVAIIIGLMFFLTWWQGTQLRVEQEKTRFDRALFLSRYLMDSGFFVKENAVFDDSKLEAFQATEGACSGLGNIVGGGWYAEVKDFGSGSWKICEKLDKPATVYVFPINIYSKSAEKTALGTLRVGVYA